MYKDIARGFFSKGKRHILAIARLQTLSYKVRKTGKKTDIYITMGFFIIYIII